MIQIHYDDYHLLLPRLRTLIEVQHLGHQFSFSDLVARGGVVP